MATLTFEILTLFPEFFDGFLGASLLGKAISRGDIAVHRTNPRDFALDKHQTVDDTPYGGGPGMVMRPEPIAAAVRAVEDERGRAHRVFLAASGARLTQSHLRRLVEKPRLLVVCGRYEGIDERVMDDMADEVLSIGDFVLSGGEVAAATLLDGLSRLVPGVMGCAASADDESHAQGRLEYPQYTRPPVYESEPVPKVLLSGNHARIATWRRLMSFLRTYDRRPELFEETPLSEEEKAWLAALEADHKARARLLATFEA